MPLSFQNTSSLQVTDNLNFEITLYSNLWLIIASKWLGLLSSFQIEA